ncbi:maleylacetoacetate isomerase [Halomonas sp. MCCC 1A11036]|uniref:Maleylacetoacetate isomerase n=1 Tax=Billgrantia zhangzhouensis TaxID=2733481 RepID=A0ABS9AJS1_9GAMM|nr:MULTISPECIES: maleylacetoacetate isomerase [Halomonas]MCE8022018.1 maleylacetoacetate isomerase [Halomonas zhangzhouensis]MCE8039733.1 maleylacetoacetate isomerase [Halomonas sp. MCCC 1A11062]
MILHDYFRSSSAFRVRIALNIKGIDYETKVQDLDQQSNRSKGYLRVNGFGLIPAIEDGEVRIAQSGAIIEYLEEKFSSPALLPLDPAGRARVRSLFYQIVCDTHPLTTRRVASYLQQNINATQNDVSMWKLAWLRDGLMGMEEVLASNSTGDFCHGNQPTLADIGLAPQVYSALSLGLRLDDMPTVSRIYSMCLELPAFQRAHPDNC